MTTARAGHATFVLCGWLYASGGFDRSGTVTTSVERYCVQEDTWEIVKSMDIGQPRSFYGAVTMGGDVEVDLWY
jgi:hypothetical protein